MLALFQLLVVCAKFYLKKVCAKFGHAAGSTVEMVCTKMVSLLYVVMAGKITFISILLSVFLRIGEK